MYIARMMKPSHKRKASSSSSQADESYIAHFLQNFSVLFDSVSDLWWSVSSISWGPSSQVSTHTCCFTGQVLSLLLAWGGKN